MLDVLIKVDFSKPSRVSHRREWPSERIKATMHKISESFKAFNEEVEKALK